MPKPPKEERSEVVTATDSDDEVEESSSFAAHYDQVQHWLDILRWNDQRQFLGISPTWVLKDVSWTTKAQVCNSDGKLPCQAMDAQLQSTHMGRTFASSAETAPEQQKGVEPGEEGEEEEELQPVDVDLNLVQSLLASYGAQAICSYSSYSLILYIVMIKLYYISISIFVGYSSSYRMVASAQVPSLNPAL